jgi:hypothetical protein
MSTVVLLPHMDDEVFIIPYLIELAKSNSAGIHIFFLTKSEGRLNKYRHAVREAESTLMLKKVAPSCKVEFLGSLLQIEDLKLHTSLDEVFNLLMKTIDSNCDIVIAPHYEGGHIDHDSSSILALKLSGELNATLHTFNLYSGRKLSRSLFRVAKPTELNNTAKIKVGRESFKHILSIPFVYKSQVRTWVGIYPSLVWRFIIRGKCEINISSDFNHLSKPNKGVVFYEGRKDGTFHEWSTNMSNFLNMGKE